MRQIPEQPDVRTTASSCVGGSSSIDDHRTMLNVLYTKEYPSVYTTALKTQVSNALLVGEVLGQVVVGVTCDYLGRKFAIVLTTLLVIVGGILATAAHGTTTLGMFWMLTVARGIVGFGAGGEYPAASTSASEAANEHTLKNRGPIFILVTNFPLSLGGPIAVIIFLIVISAAGSTRLSTVWRVCFGIGCVIPIVIFYFRIKMLNSKLYRRGAIKKRVPYSLVLKYYWKDLIGTCGAWFLYDFVSTCPGARAGAALETNAARSLSLMASSRAPSSAASSRILASSRRPSTSCSLAPLVFPECCWVRCSSTD